MRILAFDSSGAACSAAAWADGAVVAHKFEPMARGHAERLMPMIAEVMAGAGWQYAELDLLAATVGPGGFTGLRIGLAVLRALALAAGRPMLGISSLEAVARSTSRDERAGRRVVVLLESKRVDVYAQIFDADLVADTGPLALPVAALAERVAGKRLLLAGDAANRAQAAFADAGCDLRLASSPGLPDAALVAVLAAERAADTSRRPPAPLYLRPPDVTEPSPS